MNEIYNSLKLINKTFQQNRGDVIGDINLLEALSDNCKFSSFIIDAELKILKHVNDKGVEFLKIPRHQLVGQGLETAQKIIHPEFTHVLPLAISYYSDKENFKSIYPYMYYLKSGEEWQWVYACSQIVSFQPNGMPKYIILVGCSIYNILKHHKEQVNEVNPVNGFNHLEYDRYQSLSTREKQILKLISQEFTTNEIAEKLFISKATVDSHRKHLLRKLNVKSAIGLTKYVLLFEEDI